MDRVCWINYIEPKNADGRLKEVYERVTKERGRVANVFKAHSLNPEAMDAHLTLYMAIMFGDSPLSRADRELIATVTSACNRCKYCVTHHSEVLRKYLRSEELVREIIEKTTYAPVDERRRALISFVQKLTLLPSAVNEDDIQNLRRQGYSDREILDTVLVAAYFNFVNRVVLGLGVGLEAGEERVYKT